MNTKELKKQFMKRWSQGTYERMVRFSKHLGLDFKSVLRLSEGEQQKFIAATVRAYKALYVSDDEAEIIDVYDRGPHPDYGYHQGWLVKRCGDLAPIGLRKALSNVSREEYNEFRRDQNVAGGMANFMHGSIFDPD